MEAMPELLKLLVSRGRGRWCTDTNPQQAQFHAPTQQREGRECVSHDYGAVRMCAYQGTEQGDVQRDVNYSVSRHHVHPVSQPGIEPGAGPHPRAVSGCRGI
jgi:hypothetical protein